MAPKLFFRPHFVQQRLVVDCLSQAELSRRDVMATDQLSPGGHRCCRHRHPDWELCSRPFYSVIRVPCGWERAVCVWGGEGGQQLRGGVCGLGWGWRWLVSPPALRSQVLGNSRECPRGAALVARGVGALLWGALREGSFWSRRLRTQGNIRITARTEADSPRGEAFLPNCYCQGGGLESSPRVYIVLSVTGGWSLPHYHLI